MLDRFYADKDLIPQGYRPPVDVAIDDIGIKITIGGVTVTIKAKDADVSWMISRLWCKVTWLR